VEKKKEEEKKCLLDTSGRKEGEVGGRGREVGRRRSSGERREVERP